ncbi:MAG: PfkB family carbohydrate kinase [Sulfuricellaceae bacterium]
MSITKVLPLDELEILCRAHKKRNEKIVLCHGVFDLMHTGHIFHLQRAKKEGDFLVVTVTANEFVNKGPGRPVFSQELRAQTLAALGCVDYVAVNYGPTAIDVIRQLKPDVYAKGGEYRQASDDITGNIDKERQAVESVGGRIFYTDEVTFSSSSLLNEHFGVFSTETKNYLKEFRGRHDPKEIIRQVQELSRLKVLVVGDAIIDQYHYVTPMGQSGKSNLAPSVSYKAEEQFAGGSIAVANHLAGFAQDVTLVTALGKLETHENYIRTRLLPNVTPNFFYLEDAPTVTKRRFVDEEINKMFEVYFFNNEPDLTEVEIQVCDWLACHADGFDVVIVPDFGNGFISEKIVHSLCAHSPFLAVNTQINSGNRGYHVINRYPRADFISLNEPEIRLAAHNRYSPLDQVIETIGARLNVPYVAVTQGTKGALLTDRKENSTFVVPALSTKVLDRIGAGDAFLSLAGLCLGGGLAPEIAAFMGSAAAALDVQIVCNREPISSVALYKYITTLLK